MEPQAGKSRRTQRRSPFAFFVATPQSGFRWESDASSMADPDEQGPFLVQKSTGAPTEDMYRPLQDPGVFRKLAALRAAPDEVRDFADQYGFLGHPVPLLARDGTVPIWGALRRTPASTKYGAQYHIDLAQFPTGEADRIRRQLWTMHAPLGESFSFWEDEIRRAHLLLFFWDLLEQKEAGKLGKFLIWDTNPLAVKMEFAHGGSGEITLLKNGDASWIGAGVRR